MDQKVTIGYQDPKIINSKILNLSSCKIQIQKCKQVNIKKCPCHLP